MSKLRLTGSSSGFTEVTAPAVAGSNTLVLPTGNGTADQVLAGNGSGTLSFVDRGRMVLETAQATTSGTSVDFTGIPSWVKKITVMFNGVSTSGTSFPMVQLGNSGGIETTSYNSVVASSAGNVNSSAGFIISNSHAATDLCHGSMFITNLSGNSWTISGGFMTGNAYRGVSGSKTLSDTLDRIRITTVNGTNTFDAGSVNILLEG
jgi:hypothetical protein